jgi:translation initiation factor 3 subunit C
MTFADASLVKVVSDLETTSNEAYEKQKTAAKKINSINQRGLNTVRQKVRKLVKEEPYIHDVEKYRADPDGFMKEIILDTTPVAKTKKKTVEFVDNAADGDDEGFETVGRDGKALAYTPESILKSKLFDFRADRD